MIFTKAMLKMIKSFYRYSRFTCEKINFKPPHVKGYSHLSSRRKTYITLNAHNSIANEYTHAQQLRALANIKKRFLRKRPQTNTSVTRDTRPMNPQLLQGVIQSKNLDSSDSDDGDAMDKFAEARTAAFNSRGRDKVPTDFRSWEYISKKSDDDAFRFKVVSYNVLAQYLLESHPYLYTKCNPADLFWDVRFERIFKEIMDLDADILCLQEVQHSHLNKFFAKFEQCGYFGLYKQKTGNRNDGCAIYFKKDKFNLENHLTVEYFQPELTFLNRDNVALLAKLVPRRGPRAPLVVATTHLLYNPMRSDIRLAQLQILLAELDRFAYFEDGDGKRSGYNPIILTGDFNSKPDSAVVKLLDFGRVSAEKCRRDPGDWRRIAVTDNCQHLSVQLNRDQNTRSDYTIRLHNSEQSSSELPPGTEPPPSAPDLEVVRNSNLFNTSYLTHPLKLASVYSRTKRNKAREATTFQEYWVNVDYIYFSCCNNLKLLERLRLPTEAECEAMGSIPNAVCGSDHLLLAAHFELRDTDLAH